MTLKYSQTATSVRPRFFSGAADLTVIVEDLGDENFYQLLISKLLINSPLKTNVVGVGGKDSVIKFHNTISKAEQSKYFYLVDGDFDVFHGCNCPSSFNFFELNAYDIEYFLVQSSAIAMVAEEQQPRKPSDVHQKELDLSNWYKIVIDALYRYCLLVAVCRQLISSPNIRLTGALRFASSDASFINKEDVYDFINGLHENIPDVSKTSIIRELRTFSRKMGRKRESRARFISGKHVWLPLLAKRLQGHTGTNITVESLRFRLLKHWDWRALIELQQALIRVGRNVNSER